MIRNLKVLGLALAAVFAMSAVAASGAMAQAHNQGEFTTETGNPVTLLGVQTGEAKENQLSAFSLNTRCSEAIYTGHEVGSTSNGVPNKSTEVTITPHYGHCSTAGFPMSVFMNGCDYVLGIGETVAVDEYELSTEILCPEGSDIVLKQYTNTTDLVNGENAFCHATIETENPYTGLRAIDNTDGTLSVTGTLEGTKMLKTPGPDSSIFCPSEQTTEEAVLHVDLKITDSNEAVGVTITDATSE